MTPGRIPIATYRLQVNRDFDFASATAIVDYLDQLGISDLYVSPIFKSRPGSVHGYDVVDPTQIDEERGGEEEFARLARTILERGMGLLLDIVPNHMAIAPENTAWMDVLERGRASAYATWFDIRWPEPSASNATADDDRIALPVLGRPLEEAIERGDLTVEQQDGKNYLRYFEWRFPLRGSTAAPLRELLEAQPYRLVHWKQAMRRLSYRRFFDITHLIGIRVEDPEVFRATHERIIELLRSGAVTGLRIDHIDGLADPAHYLSELQEAAAGSPEATLPCYVLVEKILGGDETLDDNWPVAGTTGYDFLNALSGVFVDPDGLHTLSQHHAQLLGPPDDVESLFYERKKHAAETLFGGEVSALTEMLQNIAAMMRLGNIPVESLSHAIVEVSARLPVYRTYITQNQVHARNISPSDRQLLERALARADRKHCTASTEYRVPSAEFCSLGTLSSAFGTRHTVLGTAHPDALSLMQRVLLLDLPEAPPELPDAVADFIVKWQQFTGPLAAKGVEDTALYQDARLISLNEVGADVQHFQVPGIAGFHRHNLHAASHWPHTMTTTSTHDTKRSEDARHRIHVLSEIAEEWIAAADQWSRMNHRWKQKVNGEDAPDPVTELFLYQSMLGAWPLEDPEHDNFVERIVQYAHKAVREAKRFTNWIEPNEVYEHAIEQFIRNVLNPEQNRDWFEDFLRMVNRIAFPGAINSLSSVVLKIASPGVPDFYQGTELWDFSLVDPDNRRPVEYDLRRRFLQQIASLPAALRPNDAAELLHAWHDGRLKMLVTHRGLQLRRKLRDVFLNGEYIPLNIHGRHGWRLCSFARRLADQWVIAVAPVRIANIAQQVPSTEYQVPSSVASVLTPRHSAMGNRQSAIGNRIASSPSHLRLLTSEPVPWIVLPADAPRRYCDALTGASVEADPQGHLHVGRALALLPVALLTSDIGK